MQIFGKWLLVSTLLGFGFAMAQSEPTLNQIYQAAQAGKLDQAQVMMQQVLVAHPGSGKAHFVQAELFARQGKLVQARESLAMAEKLTPGLSFAKAESVQALRTQLAAAAKPALNSTAQARSKATAVEQSSSPASSSSSFPWGLALALGGAAIGIVVFLTRRKAAPSFEPQPVYTNQGAMQGGLSGPQGFGMGNNQGAGAMQQPYGQPPGAGLGSKIMGGVATGLAVGAGVMAAQAIGRTLTGNHDQTTRPSDTLANNDFQNVNSNPNMGGENFGVNDAASWDDAGSSDAGGGDWDN
jgi:hypothetical protein